MKVPSRCPGFSLVEIVIALGLVSFSMLAIFALVAHGQKTSRESRLESVAALLAGKVTSQLRSSAAWETNFSDYTGAATLSDIAAGQVVAITNYYNTDLERTEESSPGRQFAMVTRVGPFDPAHIVAVDSATSGALARLRPAANTVLLNIAISYPANAPEANRSSRNFSAIIGRTARH